MEPAFACYSFVLSLWRAGVCAAFGICVGLAALAGPSQTDFGDPARPMRVAWAEREIRVWVMPEPNEGYRQIARRVMADPERYAGIEQFHGGRPVMLGRPVSFPLPLVKPELRREALRALYPSDYPTERAWVHQVTFPSENLITLTEAFTGSRARFAELSRINKLPSPDLLVIGTEIEIPQEWIPDELSLRPEGVKPPLVYERDPHTRRRYAVYVIQKDETLYSSVILRFTDREFAEEVNRMAEQLIRLNGLKNPARIPAGSRLRIPLEWISEEFLTGSPQESPAAEASEASPAPPEASPGKSYTPPPTAGAPEPPRRPAAKSLATNSGLHVILDPGHGGADAGATYGRRRNGDLAYEDEVVYDIALRLGERLVRMGHAVHYTIADPNQPRPVDKLATHHDTDEIVLVTPPYRIEDVDIGLNLRVYRIESLFRSIVAEGISPDQVVLVSIHGDALAPMLRGAMVYYADPNLRSSEFHPAGRSYRNRKEAMPALIRFTPESNRSAASLSEELARTIASGLRAEGVQVAGRKPVRSFYYRNDKRTLPAVLRYSRVPSSVLVEIANLNNAQDRRQLLQASVRERIARGLAQSIDRHSAREVRLAQGQMR